MTWTSPRQITRTKPEKMIRKVKKCMSYPQAAIRVDRTPRVDSAVRPTDIAGASRAVARPRLTSMAHALLPPVCVTVLREGGRHGENFENHHEVATTFSPSPQMGRWLGIGN
jgi:hypothetical protein